MSEQNVLKSNYIFKCDTCGKSWMQGTNDPYNEKVICPECNNVTGYTGYTEQQWAAIIVKDENTKRDINSNISKSYSVLTDEDESENGVAHAFKTIAVINCIILVIAAVYYAMELESLLYFFVGIIFALIAVLPTYAIGEAIQLLQDNLTETKKIRKDLHDTNEKKII